MESLSFATLDVFTSTPYSGNPLSIIRIPASHRHLASQWRKQLMAQEFNLSESVFIHEQADPEVPEWAIDIFTTTDELPFAGHPTIGAACYMLGLQRANGVGNGKGVFITQAGRIPISICESEESGIRVQADIPHNVHIHAHTIGDLEGPVSGLSSHPKLRKAEMRAPIVSVVLGMTFLLIRLESVELLGLVNNASSELDFHGLLDQEWREGFVAKYYYVVLKDCPDDHLQNGNGGLEAKRNGAERGLTRIRTRMLEDAMEDPATGSAACALGSYLALKSRKTQRFEVVQGVEMGRRSVIGVEVVIDERGENVKQVRLSGSAVQIMEGNLRI